MTGTDEHRRHAVDASDSAWELLAAPGRTPDQDEELLRRVYAAAYHCARTHSATPSNEVRARYLIGKAWLSLGDPVRALHYAEQMLHHCAERGIVDLDLAYSYELRARSLDALGRAEEAAKDWDAARAVPIADAEDRARVEADLERP